MRRADRPAPLATRQLPQGGGERSPEELAQLTIRPVRVLAEQHEGVAEPPPRAIVGGAQRLEEISRIALRIRSPVRAQEHVAERCPPRLAVVAGVRRVVRLDLLLRRRRRLRPILQQEGHLLREAAADNRIVAVEPQLLRLAVQDLLPDRLVQQPRQLRPGRLPPPLGGPARADRRDLFVGHRDGAALRAAAVQPSVESEHAGPQQEEQHKRRSPPERCHDPSGARHRRRCAARSRERPDVAALPSARTPRHVAGRAARRHASWNLRRIQSSVTRSNSSGFSCCVQCPQSAMTWRSRSGMNDGMRSEDDGRRIVSFSAPT